MSRSTNTAKPRRFRKGAWFELRGCRTDRSVAAATIRLTQKTRRVGVSGYPLSSAVVQNYRRQAIKSERNDIRMLTRVAVGHANGRPDERDTLDIALNEKPVDAIYDAI